MAVPGTCDASWEHTLNWPPLTWWEPGLSLQICRECGSRRLAWGTLSRNTAHSWICVYLRPSCISAGKANHREGILGSQPDPLTSKRTHACLGEGDPNPPLIKIATVLPQPTWCPPKTFCPALLRGRGRLALEYPEVLPTEFAEALGFLAQNVRETWSTLWALNRWGNRLLGCVVGPCSPRGEVMSPGPLRGSRESHQPVCVPLRPGYNPRLPWLTLLRGCWSSSAISLFSEYQSWEGTRKVSRAPFHFLSSLKDTSCNKKLSPALPGVPSSRKTSGATPSFRINSLPDLSKPKPLASESHDFEPVSILPANLIWYLKFIAASFVVSLWGSQTRESKREAQGLFYFNSPRRKLPLDSLENNHYCFYIWGLNQMLGYLSFIAHPLVILHGGCCCIR